MHYKGSLKSNSFIPKSYCCFYFVAFSILCCSWTNHHGAGHDQARKKSSSKKASKTKAVLLAVILPGAGQFYNEKPWKVPILYGGIITNAYFTEFNNRRYQLFKNALREFRESGNNTSSTFPYLNEDGLIRNVDYWRRNRDATYLLYGAIYVLNIVDALVDAHLSGFDVSDDLSMKIEPAFETMTAQGNTVGISFKLKF